MWVGVPAADHATGACALDPDGPHPQGGATPGSKSGTEEEGGEWINHSGAQIFRTRAESQQIVAARPLYCLQYPVRTKSSAKDLPH
jgi:hypothetical protein